MCGWNDVLLIRSFRQSESDGWERKIRGPCEVNFLQDSVGTTMPSGQIQLKYWKVNTVDALHCWIITQWINWIRCPWVEAEKRPSSHLSLAVSFQFTPWFMRLHRLSHDAGNSHLTYCTWHHGVNEIQLVPRSLCTATFFFKLANWLPFAPFCIQTPGLTSTTQPHQHADTGAEWSLNGLKYSEWLIDGSQQFTCATAHFLSASSRSIPQTKENQRMNRWSFQDWWLNQVCVHRIDPAAAWMIVSRLFPAVDQWGNALYVCGFQNQDNVLNTSCCFSQRLQPNQGPASLSFRSYGAPTAAAQHICTIQCTSNWRDNEGTY